MILYFSGTGNSEYVAKIIAKNTGDSSLNIFDKIKHDDFTPLKSDKPWVIVVPTYAYKIPWIVEAWVMQTLMEGSDKLYFVMTCGSGIGGAGAYNKSLAKTIDKKYMGTAKIVMPENYIVMFKAPEKARALKIIDKAESSIKKAANHIKAEEHIKSASDSIFTKLWSTVVNKVFFKWIVKDNKFKTTEKCNACGKCMRACVNRNITIIDKEVIWQGNCTHCMACICGCPKQAIEYGKKTKKKVRYTCPK